MLKNVPGQHIYFQMNLLASGLPATLIAMSVNMVRDGGIETPGTGTITERPNGLYIYAPTQGETNYDSVGFQMLDSTELAIPITQTVYPIDPALFAWYQGITSLADWIGLLAGKGSDPTALAELNATAAGVAYDNTTEALEVIAQNVEAAGLVTGDNQTEIAKIIKSGEQSTWLSSLGTKDDVTVTRNS